MITYGSPWPKRIVGLAIFAAIFLTIYHALGLCSEECSHGNNYTIMGISFDWFGFLFFIPLGILFLLSYKYPDLYPFVGLLFASALGGEIIFIGFQKYVIGVWCPVCLGIAASVALGCVALLTGSYLNSNDQQGKMMKNYWNISALCLGFGLAFFGIVQKDDALAAQNSIKDSITFGKKDSNIEVYIFTDWACPACRKAEPEIDKIVEKISPEAKITFVDHVVHPETMNFIPYNLSFMINNKNQYIQLRHMLSEISLKTGKPTEVEVGQAAAKLGAKFDELDYADVAAGIDYFKQLGEKFKVKGTPTLVIVNVASKKGKKLSGGGEITEQNVTEAIKTMKSL
jgi:thiol-disulfide isomerase/thioredoxin